MPFEEAELEEELNGILERKTVASASRIKAVVGIALKQAKVRSAANIGRRIAWHRTSREETKNHAREPE
jgi:hypothetical protein